MIRPRLALAQRRQRDTEVRLGGRPVARHPFRGRLLQRQTVGHHRRLQAGRPRLALPQEIERIGEIELRARPGQRRLRAGLLLQRRLKGGDGVQQRRIVTEAPALVGPSEACRFPIGRAPLAILGRQQPGGLFMKPRRLDEAQARRLDPGLCAHQLRLLAPLIGRHPARAFRPHQMARLLQVGPRPVVIGCALQGGGGGVTQRLHVRVGQRNGADLLHQSPMLLRDPGKAIGKLRLVDRLLVENFEEPGDGLDREAAVAGDDLVQPDKQHRAISGGGRCGKLHQPRELVRRQAAEDGGRANVDAARCTERTVGLHAVAEPLRQGRGGRNRIRNQQDQKRASQAHASLRSLRRVRLILRSKASPNLCLFRDALTKATGRRCGSL